MEILPYYSLGPILAPQCSKLISEFGAPTPTRVVPRGTPTIGSWQAFLAFGKSPTERTAGVKGRAADGR